MDYRKPRILVLGDLMLDLWVEVQPRRGNPEGAAMVVQSTGGGRFETLGGAGLVAALIRSLGLRTKIMGRLGRDFAGEIAHALLHESQLGCKSVTIVDDYVTPTKMRFVNDHGIVVFRYDEESLPDVYMADYSAHFNFDTFESLVKRADALVVADYGKGYCQEVAAKIIQAARYYGALSIVGAKPSLLDAYRGADIVKVNASEAATYLDADVAQTKDCASLAEMLCARMESWVGVVTSASRGTFYSVRNEHAAYVTESAPATACFPAVKNCVGAGDAFLAGFTAALTAAPKVESPGATKRPISVGRMQLAVAAGAATASQYLGRGYPVLDAATPHLAQHARRLETTADAKIMSTDEAALLCDAWRSAGQTVVFTNGCFDLLHRGHVHLLEQAKKQGARLIVAVNTDDSVRRLKGADRPVQDFATRSRILAAIAGVDAVVGLDEDDFVAQPVLRGMLAQFEPDVLVKGAQYSENEIVGWEEMTNRNPPGVVWRCPMVADCSTSQTIAKVNKNAE